MFVNLSFYSFFSIEDLPFVRESFLKIFEGYDIRGIVLAAAEGVNINLALADEAVLIEKTRTWLQGIACPEAQAGALTFKLSYSEKVTFRRLRIKLKKEIITMGIADLPVAELRGPHMKAQDFKKLLEDPKADALILDTRNDFEVEYGTFKKAQAAGMRSFRDFPRIAQELPKDKPIVMFCTGGVRCEKASAYLRKNGFEQVYQLEGGILRYLEEEGFSHFEGECFVFDDRVALKSLGEKAREDGALRNESG